MSIQRWTPELPNRSTPADDGLWVLYSDHVAAVEAARDEGVQIQMRIDLDIVRDEVRQQAIDDCIAAALAEKVKWSVDYDDAINDVVAALRALKEQS